MSLPNLPVEFTDRMRRILGEEYGAFEKSYEEARKYGLRVNTKKISPEEFERIAPFHLSRIPWIPGGYYYQEEDAPGRHPLYHAGLYYLQEPSAMTPASILKACPGDKVLDLCAAPGGKATALGAGLLGQGLLVANDISASRAKALLKNVEVFGIPNSYITNAAPARLQERFPEFFDKILVDAPCSGEGMFRKDPDVIRAWYPGKPEECAKTQRDIILRAADMLRPGGYLLYSTCTFAPVENEEVIRYLLEQQPELELQEIPFREGFSPGLNGLEKCVRLWPHRISGEGHFLALLRKKEKAEEGFFHGTCEAREEAWQTREERKLGKNRAAGKKRGGEGQRRALEGFLSEVRWNWESDRLEIRNGQVYYISGLLPKGGGIPFLRNGLYLGEVKKERFEPSQSFAMALRKEEYPAVLDFTWQDGRIIRYLRGETIEISPGESSRESGWQLVCVNGYPLGWGKLVNGLLKNKYHAGWRMKQSTGQGIDNGKD